MDFGPVLEANFGFMRLPLFISPEIGVGGVVAFGADYLEGKDLQLAGNTRMNLGWDTQGGVVIRPALGIMYTIAKTFDIRLVPVRISIIIPVSDTWDAAIGTQVTYDMTFNARVRF